MVFNEVPGSREVFTGEVSTHSWKCHFHVFLGDFASRRVQTKTDNCNTIICMIRAHKKKDQLYIIILIHQLNIGKTLQQMVKLNVMLGESSPAEGSVQPASALVRSACRGKCSV